MKYNDLRLGQIEAIVNILGGTEKAERLLRGEYEVKLESEVWNPFEICLDETLLRLQRAITAEGWEMKRSDLARLADSAPPWPKGKDTFRSLRIRWGEGREGVIETFERHIARIRSVFGEKFWRWEKLRSGENLHEGKPVDRLPLHARNDTHHAVVEWTVVDLSANREHESVTAARGPTSIADEGLALAWLYPERVQAIDFDKYPAWFCAGYELDVPEDAGGSWQYVPVVYWRSDVGEVRLDAHWCDDDDSGYSVPAVRECRH